MLEGRRNSEFMRPRSNITGVCNIPGSVNRALCVSNEKKIWDTNDELNGSDTKYDISQVQMLANGKAFFAGVGEAGHPGAI